MANEEHVKLVIAGEDAILAWRKAPENRPHRLDLENATFQNRDLSRIDFSGANLEGANLKGANLVGADFSGANLRGANLQDAILVRANFSRTNLEGADFWTAKLGETNFSGANLSNARFNTGARRLPPAPVNFRGANLSGTDFNRSDLAGCDFRSADLRNANLREVRCYNAVFGRANLEGANLAQAKGLALDDNPIRGARFEPYASDHWSVLRRSYTGARLLFNVLLMLAFFVPITAKTLFWTGLNRVETHIGESFKEADKLPDSVRILLKELTKSRTQFREYSVWQMLIGADRGWFSAALTIALLLYNVCRGLLTRVVGALRDEEERSGRSPRLSGLGGYRWLIWPHRVVQVLAVVAAIYFAWNAWHWLTASVWLPP